MNANPFTASLLPILAGALLSAPSSATAETPPASAEQIIPWLDQHWVSDGWGADGSKQYMRPLSNTGWQDRMLALQALAKASDKAVPPLLAVLNDKESTTEMRIFAAQTLGFVPAKSGKASLLAALSSDPSAAVRLYAADAIGMNGLGAELKNELKNLREKEENDDVRKHIAYVLGRGENGIDPAAIKKLTSWDAATIDTAKIGSLAPDFELQVIDAEKVKLSSFRGKSPVILVFIYGDT